MGPIGKDSEDILSYFCSISNKTPGDASNPSDFCLDVLSGMDAKQAEDLFSKSKQNSALEEAIETDLSSRRDPPKMDHLKVVNNPFFEVGLLTIRQFVVEWRNPSYSLMRLMSSTAMSLYMGILFSGDKSQIDGAVFSIGAIFFLGAFEINSFAVIDSFVESSLGMYLLSPVELFILITLNVHLLSSLPSITSKSVCPGHCKSMVWI